MPVGGGRRAPCAPTCTSPRSDQDTREASRQRIYYCDSVLRSVQVLPQRSADHLGDGDAVVGPLRGGAHGTDSRRTEPTDLAAAPHGHR